MRVNITKAFDMRVKIFIQLAEKETLDHTQT